MTHEVAPGEYLSMIAAQYGFSDYKAIWEHPDNAAIKAKRKNPNVLQPGDTLSIPDKEQKTESGATSVRHTFEVTAGVLMLSLVLEDMYEKPIGNTPVTLALGQQVLQVTTDSDGKIRQRITPDIQSCIVIIKSEETPFQNDSFHMKVGALDPADSFAGQRSRLDNLGYGADDASDSADQLFLSAVEEFQCDHGLPITGAVDGATQGKLVEVHGC